MGLNCRQITHDLTRFGWERGCGTPGKIARGQLNPDPTDPRCKPLQDKRARRARIVNPRPRRLSRGAQLRTWGTSYVYSPFTRSINWPSRALTRRPFFVRTHPPRSALIFALSFRNPSIRASGRTGQPGMKMSVGTNVYEPFTMLYES